MTELSVAQSRYPQYAHRIGYADGRFTFDGIVVSHTLSYFCYWIENLWEGDRVDGDE